MKLRDSILTALLMAIGLVLHQITPPIMGSMKPNFLLAMLFVALFINPVYQNALLGGFLGGIFAALTTTFPGGQVANFIEEIITAFVVVTLIRLTARFNRHIAIPVIAFIGTMESGIVFLAIASAVVGGLPLAFSVLVTTVVIPTAAINTVVTYAVYNIAYQAQKAIGKV
ncbi:tryptophan transporter [Calorimonas adulescens]|jgi:hypothetical protein|uniref:Tryptophan transporter n=1 Tax=Calorimonas adulescens TaxID=2606906 RepID=A0A5D8QCN8_9THEO|nr:tryptophan transporter [Calorimonas adulescens]TZE81293.1 tryptophan transporter [Calorimonas adulescens]